MSTITAMAKPYSVLVGDYVEAIAYKELEGYKVIGSRVRSNALIPSLKRIRFEFTDGQVAYASKEDDVILGGIA